METNVNYQRRLAETLVAGLGIEAAMDFARENAWDGGPRPDVRERRPGRPHASPPTRRSAAGEMRKGTVRRIGRPLDGNAARDAFPRPRRGERRFLDPH